MTTPASVFSSSSFFLPPASSSSPSAAFGGPRTTTNPPGPKPAPMSKIFNGADADITFKSSDGVQFRVHRKNLEVCAEGFPPAEISSTGEVVALTETSATLELLFQFMYPKRHPALDTTPFTVLEPLAEAAEKYQVFPAINICHIRMRDMVKDHPAPVFVYAAKHDYPYLVSEVAPAMISMSPIEVVKILPPYLMLPWVRYVQKWVTVLQKTALVPPAGHRLAGCNQSNQ
ncbi:hypothetical protein C8J57DRAFT_1207536 [Mycena rebaudengoi]|nr:hypothetical protein C8J57DRAFT_1207536 [Mycena rebaudengoi]